MSVTQLRAKAPARQTIVTRIVTETIEDNPDPATLLSRMRRQGTGDVIRIAVMTQDGDGALTGAAVQEFDGNGHNLSRRSSNVLAGDQGPVVELKLDETTVATLSFNTKDAYHLAPQIASQWTNGLLTA